jgi:hypothetical protein
MLDHIEKIKKAHSIIMYYVTYTTSKPLVFESGSDYRKHKTIGKSPK